jgi:hypothetical protein
VLARSQALTGCVLGGFARFADRVSLGASSHGEIEAEPSHSTYNDSIFCTKSQVHGLEINLILQANFRHSAIIAQLIPFSPQRPLCRGIASARCNSFIFTEALPPQNFDEGRTFVILALWKVESKLLLNQKTFHAIGRFSLRYF